MQKYWRFYWPLVLTGLVTILAAQFQNGVLAAYADAEREIATFALASSTFQFLNACLLFVPHMTNVMVRSGRSRKRCFRFTVAAGVSLSLPLLFLGFAPAGSTFIAWAFGLDASTLPQVLAYLRLLTPLLLVNGLRHYCSGLLVQAKKTRTVTVLGVVHASALIACLLLGLRKGWSPVLTLSGAMLAASSLSLAVVLLVVGTTVKHRPAGSGPPTTYGEIFHFFWPVALTSVMFALSRPIMYAFISRGPDAIVTVAAMRVAFVLAMLFHNPANQLRHVFATFGKEDRRGARRFMWRTMLVLFGLMAAIVFTPLGKLILGHGIGIQGETLRRAVETLRILSLTPVVVTIRNYYHGQLMVNRRTAGMAAGAVVRVALIALGAFLLFRAGRMDHVGGAALLILGFVAEAVVSRVFTKGRPDGA